MFVNEIQEMKRLTITPTLTWAPKQDKDKHKDKDKEGKGRRRKEGDGVHEVTPQEDLPTNEAPSWSPRRQGPELWSMPCPVHWELWIAPDVHSLEDCGQLRKGKTLTLEGERLRANCPREIFLSGQVSW